jgi:hypothetical protein
MRALILVVAMLAVPEAAAEHDRFDLVCTAKKSVVRYRIDLAAKRYCAGDCTVVRPIVEVSAAEIVLERHMPAFRSDITQREIINRATGSWTYYFDMPAAGLPVTQDGICEKAAYSGLPESKF